MLAFNQSEKIMIGQQTWLSLEDGKNISTGRHQLELNPISLPKIQESYGFLRGMIAKRIPIYGINTQFGDQVNLLDEAMYQHQDHYLASIEARQKNLIKSHCCGLGEITLTPIVRLAMALRAQCLSQGHSGVSLASIHAILGFINAGITPIVRRYGSIGASGDLIPLASIATAIIGEKTEVTYQGEIISAEEAIKHAGLKKFIPEMRDGLAMINGTSFMTAIACLALHDLNRLFKQMLTVIAMLLEAMLVIESAYHPVVHQLKHHRGEMEVNDYLLSCFSGSQLLTDLDELRNKNIETNARPIQDVYSLRAIAQGFGPFSENLQQANQWIENEMNSVNDNPIVDVKNHKIHHGANFMGYYVTDTCDILKMNIAQASTWLHALLANIVHPRKNHGLPTSLVSHPEKQNGFRPLQLLAASIVVQNRKLAQSHQAFMLPTEGDNQDVNSLGTHAAFDLKEAVANLERLTAITLIAAVQALEFRGIQKASNKAKNIYQTVRKRCEAISHCRPLTDDIHAVIALLQENIL
jgi:histidine ammonia-lyase